MAEERNIRIEDDKGNIYYPHTKANIVFTKDGKNIEDKVEEAFQLGVSTKNDLVSILTSKGATGLTTSSTWQQVKNALQNISTGKKIATGSQVPIKESYTALNGKIFNYNAIKITNLDFNAQILYAYTEDGLYTVAVLYNGDNRTLKSDSSFQNVEKIQDPLSYSKIHDSELIMTQATLGDVQPITSSWNWVAIEK